MPAQSTASVYRICQSSEAEVGTFQRVLFIIHRGCAVLYSTCTYCTPVRIRYDPCKDNSRTPEYSTEYLLGYSTLLCTVPFDKVGSAESYLTNRAQPGDTEGRAGTNTMPTTMALRAFQNPAPGPPSLTLKRYLASTCPAYLRQIDACRESCPIN